MVYYLMIAWPAVLYIISRLVPGVYEYDEETGEQTNRFTIGFALLAVIPLIYWAAVRTHFGDTYLYIASYQGMPTAFGEIIPYVRDSGKDKGFLVLSIIIKIITGGSVKGYFAIIASMQAIPLALIYRKYSVSFITAIFIFIASTDYLSWMFNGVRQFTAAMIIFAASSWMIDRKYIRFAMVVAIASTVHLSALLMMPIMLIARGEPWRIKTFLMIGGLVLTVIYIGTVTGWLDDALQGTQYEEVVTDWKTGNDDGTNPIRALVYSVPTILSIFGLKYIRDDNDDMVNLMCNLSIISTMIYIMSMITSGIFVGRLPIYCSIYANGILLPWEIDRMFTENSGKIVNMIMVAGFVAFYYFQMHYTWGVI